MARHLSGRVLLGLLTIVGVLVLTFLLLFVVPGDPARGVAGPRASEETLEVVRQNLKLDEPLSAQLGNYLAGVAQGDLGISYKRLEPVTTMIADALPNTLLLAVAGLSVSILLGSLVGLLDGLRRRRSFIVATVNIGLLSVPAYALGLGLLIVFGYELGWAPVTGGVGAAELVLPALTLGMFGVPYYANVVRDAVQEATGAAYTRTAVAKGLSRGLILRRHVLRNAVSPLITMAGLDFALYLSGVVFVESIFAWPGIGLLQTQAFSDLDRPVLMGTVIVAAVAVVVANLAADVIRSFVDPRARLEAS